MFELDARLQDDCVQLADWGLCRVLLMNEKRYPWFILVPRVTSTEEIIELSEEQQMLLQQESNQLARFLKIELDADKLNIAALGNIVAQLHIHHIARFRTDAAWPAPVWGKFPNQKYSDKDLQSLVNKFQQYFKDVKP